MSAAAPVKEPRVARARGAGAIPSAALVQHVMGEFLEMPGLRLTLAQAARLWALEPGDCEQLLDSLVEARFLSRAGDGAYQRCPSDVLHHQ